MCSIKSGWQAMFWLSVMPLVVKDLPCMPLCDDISFNPFTNWLLDCLKLILAIGTKLQSIITRMAIEIQERHAVVQGIPLVQVSDEHFWFNWPELVLHLIHLTLFQVDNRYLHTRTRFLSVFFVLFFLWIKRGVSPTDFNVSRMHLR